MSDRGKRVSDLAKAWGLSVNGVKYRLKKAFPEPSDWIRDEDGSILVSPEQEARILEIYGHDLTEGNFQDDEKAQLQALIEDKNRKIEELEARYKDLQALYDAERTDARKREERQATEIQKKDDQITGLIASLERSQQSLMAEQALHQQALTLIPAPDEDAQEAEIVEHEDVPAEEVTPPKTEKKKGFWARIFG